jgi:uncharacterized protein
MKTLLLVLIRLYRISIGPFLPTQCRYHPTCSAYMVEAIERHGAWKGIIRGVKRILRCNPFFPGGYDPVQ